MQVRVDQLVPYGFADTAISTFHAFGDRLIREFALEVGRSPDARVLSRADTVVFLRERLFELGLDEYRPLGDPTRFLGALATLFARCRDEDVSPARYAAHAAAPGCRGGCRASGARRGAGCGAGGPRCGGGEARGGSAAGGARPAYERYTALLAERGGDRLRRPGLARPRVCCAIRRRSGGRSRRRFRYILVDEFQDTNRVQSELVKLLAEPHRNVTVVGDDDQSIYRFRGAAISNILEFRDRHRGARTVVLRRNYRSTAPILDAAHRLVRFNDPDRLEARVGISKQLRPERPRARPIRSATTPFATGAEEADWIAAELRRRIDGGGTSAGPRRPRPRQRRRGPDPPKPQRRRRPVAVLGIVRAVRPGGDPGPAGVPAGHRGSGLEHGRLRPRRVARLRPRRGGPQRGHGIGATAAPLRPGRCSRRSTSQPEVLRLTDAGRRDRRAARRRPPAVPRPRPPAAGRRGALRVPPRHRLARDARRGRLGRRRTRRWPTSPGSSTSCAANRRCWPTTARSSWPGTSATLIDAGDDPASAEPDPDLDAVAVLTVHKAKGLEFPVVILPGLVAGRFPERVAARAARDAGGARRRRSARRATPTSRRSAASSTSP